MQELDTHYSVLFCYRIWFSAKAWNFKFLLCFSVISSLPYRDIVYNDIGSFGFQWSVDNDQDSNPFMVMIFCLVFSIHKRTGLYGQRGLTNVSHLMSCHSVKMSYHNILISAEALHTRKSCQRRVTFFPVYILSPQAGSRFHDRTHYGLPCYFF